MKWFKHQTTKTLTTDKLIDAVGISGYGRYYLLLELIAGHVDSPEDDSGLLLSLKKWAEHLRFKTKNVHSFFIALQNIGLILFQQINNELQVKIVNLSKLISNSAMSSSKRATSGQPREEEKERSNIPLFKIESKHITECPIINAALAAKARLSDTVNI